MAGENKETQQAEETKTEQEAPVAESSVEEAAESAAKESIAQQIADLKAVVADLKEALTQPVAAQEAPAELPKMEEPEVKEETQEVSEEAPEDMPNIEEPQDEEEPVQDVDWGEDLNDVINHD